ncbi:hypothetical protein COU56_02190 [Candidatus Pacearchaeota archaeon CG10_big_fil_rev_8_21_14_0_10_31_9]|nr:MAG: hypothetical protein COU56_02190 [Candidatus Pacearchaeota archaeon CG10_big_fil_rev_8_21_14_0_10_31_9]
MACGQRRDLEEISKQFRLGHLSDGAFFALRKSKCNIQLKPKDLTSLDEAAKYMDSVSQGYEFSQELNNERIIHLNSQEQIDAFNHYLQFARKNRIANIPHSIEGIKATVEKVRKGEHVETKEVEYAESLFKYLLRHSLTRIDRELYG